MSAGRHSHKIIEHGDRDAATSVYERALVDLRPVMPGSRWTVRQVLSNHTGVRSPSRRAIECCARSPPGLRRHHLLHGAQWCWRVRRWHDRVVVCGRVGLFRGERCDASGRACRHRQPSHCLCRGPGRCFAPRPRQSRPARDQRRLTASEEHAVGRVRRDHRREMGEPPTSGCVTPRVPAVFEFASRLERISAHPRARGDVRLWIKSSKVPREALCALWNLTAMPRSIQAR